MFLELNYNSITKRNKMEFHRTQKESSIRLLNDDFVRSSDRYTFYTYNQTNKDLIDVEVSLKGDTTVKNILIVKQE
jgi:hypothetical protein